MICNFGERKKRVIGLVYLFNVRNTIQFYGIVYFNAKISQQCDTRRFLLIWYWWSDTTYKHETLHTNSMISSLFIPWHPWIVTKFHYLTLNMIFVTFIIWHHWPRMGQRWLSFHGKNKCPSCSYSCLYTHCHKNSLKI